MPVHMPGEFSLKNALAAATLCRALGIKAPAHRAGSPAQAWRVAGGGARSAWWMQLKADLTGIPVELAATREPGTFGAALLAGIGVGTYTTLEEAAGRVRIRTRFEPDSARRERFAERMAVHRAAVGGG